MSNYSHAFKILTTILGVLQTSNILSWTKPHMQMSRTCVHYSLLMCVHTADSHKNCTLKLGFNCLTPDKEAW